MHCLGLALNIILSSGKLNSDFILKSPPKYLDAEMVPMALDNCTSLTGSSHCEIAFRQEECLFLMAGRSSRTFGSISG